MVHQGLTGIVKKAWDRQ